jgi:cystathionine beta-lyase
VKFASKLVHFDKSPGDPLRPLTTPFYQTATFEQEYADSFGKFDYSRSGKPTGRVLEDEIAALENSTRGFAFSSGMAAIAKVTHLLKAGDEILADWDVYGGPRGYLSAYFHAQVSRCVTSMPTRPPVLRNRSPRLRA